MFVRGLEADGSLCLPAAPLPLHDFLCHFSPAHAACPPGVNPTGVRGESGHQFVAPAAAAAATEQASGSGYHALRHHLRLANPQPAGPGACVVVLLLRRRLWWLLWWRTVGTLVCWKWCSRLLMVALPYLAAVGLRRYSMLLLVLGVSQSRLVPLHRCRTIVGALDVSTPMGV